MIQSFHFRDKGSGPPFSTCKVEPCRFRGKSSSPGSGIFPENLACGGSPLSGPEIGNDMFHRLILYGHENKRVYREVENRQTDQDGGIGACCLCRIQLSVFTGNIPRMGSGSHCLLQGILQVSVYDSLPAGGRCHTFLHPQLSGLLANRRKHEPDMLYLL